MVAFYDSRSDQIGRYQSNFKIEGISYVVSFLFRYVIASYNSMCRSLDCKSNKSSSMWTGGACCVSLARGGEGTLASGHVDGTLYLNGRLLLRYALPPTALVLLPPYVSVVVLRVISSLASDHVVRCTLCLIPPTCIVKINVILI